MVTFPQARMAHILPANATVYERTLASQVDHLLDLPIPIRDLWNPWTCPEDLLPYLAWALSVDIWSSDWPITKRRSVIANAIKHHRLKGTLAGTETYLSLIDSQVVKAIVPPAKVFSGPSLTKEARERWLSGLPQIRVWRQYERSVAGLRVFAGGQNYNSFFEGKFFHTNDAISRLRRRARWVVNGTETDTKVEEFDSHFRMFLKGTLKHSVFSKQASTINRFYVPSTAHNRIVTIAPYSMAPWRSPVGPKLQAVNSEPELIAQRGLEGHAVYSGRCIGNRFFVPSRSAFRLFERYSVFDGSAPTRRPSIQFMGVGRYGIPGHTAEIKVKMREKQNPYKAGEGIQVPKTRFWIPHNNSLFDSNRRAIVASKRRSDTIWIDSNTKPGFLAGLPAFAGDPIVV